MDPNANLREQMQIVDGYLADDVSWDDCENDMERLCELVSALDSWIRSGGFLPKDWSK